jgi:hypothetical protein
MEDTQKGIVVLNLGISTEWALSGELYDFFFCHLKYYSSPFFVQGNIFSEIKTAWSRSNILDLISKF